MTPDDRKRRIEHEISALERHGADQVLPQKLSRLERLGDLYYEIDQFQDAYNKYHDYRTLGISSGHLTSAEALAVRIKESWCLYERGALHETERSLEEAEALIRSLPPPEADALLAELHILYGYLEIRKSRYDESLSHCDQAFRILERSGDDAALAKLQICFGHVYFRTGELARAREYYEDALASARRSSDPRRGLQATINLALVCKEQSDHDRALYLLGQAQEVLKKTGDFSYRGHVLLNMAVIHSHRGDLQLAEEAYRDSLQIYLQTGQQQCVALARIGLARGQALRGKTAEARSLLQSTLELCQERGYLREEVLIRRDLGDLERSRGDPEEALRLYEEARVAALPLGDSSEHVVQIGRRVGLALLRLGRVKEATAELRGAAAGARRIGERYEEAILTCSLGTLAAQEGRWDESDKMYRTGIDMLRRMGERIELGKALVRHVRLGLGNVRNDEGDFHLELAEARKIFDEAGLPLWVGKTRLEEARLFARDQVSEKAEAAIAEAERIFSQAGDPRLVDRVDQQ